MLENQSSMRSEWHIRTEENKPRNSFPEDMGQGKAIHRSCVGHQVSVRVGNGILRAHLSPGRNSSWSEKNEDPKI